MSYPMEWIVDGEDETGTVTFVVEGEEYKFRLDRFSQAFALSRMMDAAVAQGKKLAYENVRDAAIFSIDKCIRE